MWRGALYWMRVWAQGYSPRMKSLLCLRSPSGSEPQLLHLLNGPCDHHTSSARGCADVTTALHCTPPPTASFWSWTNMRPLEFAVSTRPGLGLCFLVLARVVGAAACLTRRTKAKGTPWFWEGRQGEGLRPSQWEAQLSSAWGLKLALFCPVLI